MAVRILLGDAEIDVEEQHPPTRGGLGRAAVKQLPQPCWVNEPLVSREGLDR